MSVTQAMSTGASGLYANQIALEVIGDNIANLNTTAFKSNRADFETQFALTLRDGTAPGDGLGGTNPSQVGLGTALGAIQRSFIQGSISPTGNPSDLAIEGEGFFVLKNSSNEQFYTRDGAFGLDTNTNLVSKDGYFVQGWQADAAGNIDTTAATSALVIPIGTLTQVQATAQTEFDGNLNADSELATSGAVQTSAPLLTANGPATAATALTDLVDNSGTALFSTGDTIRISGVSKGGFDLPDQNIVVGTDVTTVGDLMNNMQSAFAINTDPTLGESAGVTIDNQGQIVISSNLGSANAVEVSAGDIVNQTKSTAPLTFSTTTQATGEGVTTSFQVYDSLGNPVNVRLRLAQIQKGDAGTTWQYYAESEDDSDLSNVLGSGTISFDQNGQFLGSTGNNLSVNLAGTGAVDPLQFTMDFSKMTGLNNGTTSSDFHITNQDGKPYGVLVDFSVSEDGVITGTFSNGLEQTLGQVALATFTNPNGLKQLPDNNFTITENSGTPNIVAPKQSNAGRIKAGSLEMSNVDLVREFIGLINAQTGFSASSRVIRTADELLQELLLIGR